jgi:hypothetical protein
MRLLFGENKEKTIQYIKEVSYSEAFELIKADNGVHEVIDLGDPGTYIRIYIDIDSLAKEDPLEMAFELLNKTFKCSNTDWAVCTGNREGKWSYHFLSKKYKIEINLLRIMLIQLSETYSWIDHSSICIAMNSKNELVYLRLPNQSKHSINKPARPLEILQGELKDFFVTRTDDLIRWH